MTDATTPTKGERTQARILEAAVERFGQNGFRPTSVAAIAREAGVSAAAPFDYWPSKEALFDAAVDHDAHAVIADLLGGVGESSELAVWLALTNRLMAVLEHHPLARRVLAGQEPEVIDRVLDLPSLREFNAQIEADIAAGQASGEVRADVDAKEMADGLEAIVLSLLMGYLQARVDMESRWAIGALSVVNAALRPSE